VVSKSNVAGRGGRTFVGVRSMDRQEMTSGSFVQNGAWNYWRGEPKLVEMGFEATAALFGLGGGAVVGFDPGKGALLVRRLRRVCQ
jgi:hypothetical protein